MLGMLFAIHIERSALPQHEATNRRASPKWSSGALQHLKDGVGRLFRCGCPGVFEKFGVWADVPRDDAGRPDLWAAFDESLILTNIVLYVAPRSFVTSTWLYRGRVLGGSHLFPAGSRVTVPTRVAAFPDPVFPLPPRSFAERSYRIKSWTAMERGGHCAALEQPDLLLVRRNGPFGRTDVSGRPLTVSAVPPTGARGPVGCAHNRTLVVLAVGYQTSIAGGSAAERPIASQEVFSVDHSCETRGSCVP